MSEKAALETRSLEYWPEHLKPPLDITMAYPFWRAAQGFLIHRPRHGRVYLHDRSRMSFDWFCGGTTNNPIPVKPECMEGLRPCVVCETKWQGAVPTARAVKNPEPSS